MVGCGEGEAVTWGAGAVGVAASSPGVAVGCSSVGVGCSGVDVGSSGVTMGAIGVGVHVEVEGSGSLVGVGAVPPMATSAAADWISPEP